MDVLLCPTVGVSSRTFMYVLSVSVNYAIHLIRVIGQHDLSTFISGAILAITRQIKLTRAVGEEKLRMYVILFDSIIRTYEAYQTNFTSTRLTAHSSHSI